MLIAVQLLVSAADEAWARHGCRNDCALVISQSTKLGPMTMLVICLPNMWGRHSCQDSLIFLVAAFRAAITT